MEYSFTIGMVAAVLTTASFLPQVIKCYKTRQTKDISIIMYSLFSLGVAFWVVYGIIVEAVPVIIANAITLLLVLSIIYFKSKFG